MKTKDIWLIKAFLKTYEYHSLNELIDAWEPVIGSNATFDLKNKYAFTFKFGVSYRYPCDNGGSVLILRTGDSE